MTKKHVFLGHVGLNVGHLAWPDLRQQEKYKVGDVEDYKEWWEKKINKKAQRSSM